MFVRTKETYENSGLGVIIESNHWLWLNEKNEEGTLRREDFPVVTRKYHSDYRKYKFEIVGESKEWRFSVDNNNWL